MYKTFTHYQNTKIKHYFILGKGDTLTESWKDHINGCGGWRENAMKKGQRETSFQ